MIEQFFYFDEWFDEIKNRGLSYESWGICGSAAAHNIEGKVVGEWVVAADTCDGRAGGWLNTNEEID